MIALHSPLPIPRMMVPYFSVYTCGTYMSPPSNLNTVLSAAPTWLSKVILRKHERKSIVAVLQMHACVFGGPVGLNVTRCARKKSVANRVASDLWHRLNLTG